MTLDLDLDLDLPTPLDPATRGMWGGRLVTALGKLATAVRAVADALPGPTPDVTHVRVSRGTDQGIPDNAVTEIDFDAVDEVRGTGLVVDGAGIRAEAAGVFLVDAVLRLDGPNWGERTGYLRINGVEVHRFGQPNSGDGSHISTAKVLPLAAGDVVTVAAYVIGAGVIARSWIPSTACSLGVTRLGA